MGGRQRAGVAVVYFSWRDDCVAGDYCLHDFFVSGILGEGYGAAVLLN